METDAAAGIERLYREQGDRIWRAVALYAGDRDLASDAVSEAFAQALARGNAVRDAAAWVWRASFRIAAGELKARSRRSAPAAREGLDAEVVGLMEALEQLPTKQRAAVVLFYYGGYPQTEIATILGMRASTVGVHLHRARKRLRSILEADDDA